jgi:hypothetical protein
VTALAVLAGVLLARVPWLAAQQHSPALSTQDYIDIQQLYARYYTAIDSGKGEAWADTFVSDGVFNELKGRDALVNLVHDYYRNGGGSMRRHWHTNLVITPTAEGATGNVYLMQVDVKARPPVIYSHSHYDDVLVKTPRGWLFKSRIRGESTLNN